MPSHAPLQRHDPGLDRGLFVSSRSLALAINLRRGHNPEARVSYAKTNGSALAAGMKMSW
jgi:hypothetical protein